MISVTDYVYIVKVKDIDGNYVAVSWFNDEFSANSYAASVRGIYHKVAIN